MKYLHHSFLLTSLLSLSLSASVIAIETPANTQQILVEKVGFSTPESIEYYASEDIYLVSNLNGSALDAEGNGFISKVSPNGRLIKLKWLDGTRQGTRLNSPKGIAIQGKKLYVADINEVHIFDLPSGQQQPSIYIKGSTFLNGITPGKSGEIYVTDSGLKAGDKGYSSSKTDAIYKISPNGSYELIFKDKTFGHPNGLIKNGEDIIFVTFGSGKVSRIDAHGKQHSLPTPPKGSLDGLLMLDDGRLLLSSWEGSALYLLNKDMTYHLFADTLNAPADLGFDSKRQRVLVPLFKQNKLVFIPLSKH